LLFRLQPGKKEEMKYREIITFCLLIFAAIINCDYIDEQEQEAEKVFKEINQEHILQSFKLSQAGWNYELNLTRQNAEAKNEAQKVYKHFIQDASAKLVKFNYKAFRNYTLKRILEKYSDTGDSALDVDEFMKLKQAVMNMQTRYGAAKFPTYSDPKKFVTLEPEITKTMKTSRNPDELKYYWTKWYDATGTPSRNDFYKYVELKNKASKKNGKFLIFLAQ
jgi:peptidyl-dipeptidase A